MHDGGVGGSGWGAGAGAAVWMSVQGERVSIRFLSYFCCVGPVIVFVPIRNTFGFHAVIPCCRGLLKTINTCTPHVFRQCMVLNTRSCSCLCVFAYGSLFAMAGVMSTSSMNDCCLFLRCIQQ